MTVKALVDPLDPDVLIMGDWEPNRREFGLYVNREVQMCLEAIKKGLARHETLFSTATWLQALGLMVLVWQD